MKKLSTWFRDSRGNFKFPKIRIKHFSWRNFDKKSFFTWAFRIAAVFLALVALLFIIYAHDLPDPDKVLSRSVPQSTKIYARDGSLLYEVHGEIKRTLIPFDQMNSNIKNATIAIEDRNFYNESGISLRGILRSIWADVTSGSKSQGASTITQQFVRNALLTRDKNFSRKIKEIILSLEMNRKFSKDDILKLYLNEIPYGRNAYGIEAASQAYFNIDAKDLDLAQAAYMAALPQSPSYLSPTGPNRDALDARKNTVLDQMAAQGYINNQQRDDAKKEVVTFQKPHDSIVAPNFVMYVEDYLTQKYGEQALENGGLSVTTTLDPKLQKIAEQVITDGVAKNAKNYNGHNGALVAIDPKTGQILAMVGSKDYFGESEPAGCTPGLNCTFEPNVNVATSQRQAGSSMKPYVYVTAFKPEFAQSPATMRVDVTTDFNGYIPHNYNGNSYGPVSIRQALAGSLNVPAVKTLALVGIDNAIQTMRDVGITSPLKDCGLPLVLGGCEVTLLDHVSGYSTFADMGVHHQDTAILKIEDTAGNVLEQYQDKASQVIDPQAVYELVSIMTDNDSRKFTFGSSANYLILPDRPVAAKTGTTQNYKDGWTLGFTPSLVAGVWTGNNDGTLMKVDAVITAGPIWQSFMKQALAGTPVEQFPVPNGIQQVTVDALSGMLPGPYTQATKVETFASYSVPKQVDNTHFQVTCADNNIQPPFLQMPNNPSPQNTDNPQGNTANPQPTPACTPGIYTFFHSEKPDDPAWENPTIAWEQAHYGALPSGATISDGTASGSGGSTTGNNNPPTASITAPKENATIQGPFNVETNITPDPNNKITHVDLLVDGTITQNSSTAPYSFYVPALAAGDHVIAIHVVDNQGNTADTSVTIKTK